MIESIHISNYALIDNIDIDFAPGLNVITGETGAGKSIIMGALSLILGGRADTRVMSDATRKSVVEAVFKIDDYPEVARVCADNDLDINANGTDSRLIMRREITAAGRSRAFINDTPVTLGVMRELAMHLVDIHSQHQNLLLAQSDFQRQIIDRLAANSALLDDYTVHYNALRQAVRRLKRAKSDIAKSREDEEFMRFQLSQLDALDARPGEVEELESERDRQANLSVIKESIDTATMALTDGEPSIISLLDTVTDSVYRLERQLDAEADLPGRLQNLRVELQDIAQTIAALNSDIDDTPHSLDDIDERLDRINDMLRRHHLDTVEQLDDLRASLRRRLEQLENADVELDTLDKNARRAFIAARNSAAQLTESRLNQAERFAAQLKERAVPLGMKNLQCDITIAKADFSPTGADNVEFRFSFNKNQPLLPVGETASGGEISRLMLSIKAIIAEHIHLPSLILDEIDTGVSGDVANRMGGLMLDIGHYSQVIVITHLPQVAAKGNNHFKVYKEDDDTATHTRITRLDGDERVKELATMLSGNPLDPSAQATARNLLDNR